MMVSRVNIGLATRWLLAGGVIAYPTEAVWGLGCDPWNVAAVRRILEIKGRPVSKGLILVAASVTQLGGLYDSLTEKQKAQLDDTWPGPTTWLLPDPENLLPRWIKGEHSAVAVRVSSHPVVRALCDGFGGLLVSTSANRAGRPEIRSRLRLQCQLGAKLDFVVPGGLGGQQQPSTIRDLVSGRVLR